MATNKPRVIKKDGSVESFNIDKIISAVGKSASRVLVELSDEEKKTLLKKVNEYVDDYAMDIPVSKMHNFVECALDDVNPKVAQTYREYRDHKKDALLMHDELIEFGKSLKYLGDKSNANTDSSLIATQGSLLGKKTAKILYRKLFLNEQEVKDIDEGWYYIHDTDARLLTMNCCLFDIASVLEGGHEMANMWYNEPGSLDVAMDVIADITLSTASQQYGGFTMCEIDKVLEKYAEKSYKLHLARYDKFTAPYQSLMNDKELVAKHREECAMDDLRREIEQGFQGWEYKFNTLGSSRGDYPFVTTTLGLATSKFGKLINEVALGVRKDGQGKKGFKKPVLFPKIVFLYTEKLHGEGKELEDIFNMSIECSSKALYPDYLSLDKDPDNHNELANMYHNYGEVISPMGCRAFLSPYWEKGGHYQKDDSDKPVFVGRWNGGKLRDCASLFSCC